MVTQAPGGKTKRRTRGDGGLSFTGGLWIASVDLGYGADGKRRRKRVASKDYATAVKKLRLLRRQVENTGGSIPTGSMTTGAWLERWLTDVAAPRVKPRTLAGYRTTVRQHLIPHLGARRIDQLAPQHVRDAHRALAAGDPRLGRRAVSQATILKAHRVLAKALRDAMREGVVTRNVAELLDAPRRAPNQRDALTAEQARHLLASTATSPMAARWTVALTLGTRQGEALGMTWDRVDLAASTVDLSWQLQRLSYAHGCEPKPCGRKFAGNCPKRYLEVPAGFEHEIVDGGLVLTRPKSRAGQRVVPLPAVTAAVLARHRGLTASHRFVFTRDGTRPLDPRQDYGAWVEALRHAGIPPVPLHSARHTTATLLLEAGVDAHVVAQIMGHSDVVTSRGYQHVSLVLAQEAMGRLDLTLAPQLAVPTLDQIQP